MRMVDGSFTPLIDPEIYLLAADRLGVETKECIFIDDRQRFCDAAEETGMKGIAYKSLAKLKKDLEPLLATL